MKEKKIHIEMPAHALMRLEAFCSTNATRYYLHGICLDGSYAVATDGHRMGVINAPTIRVVGVERPIIAVRNNMRPLLKKALRDNHLATASIVGSSAEQVIRIGGGAAIGNFLIDGDFPDWRRVLPNASESARLKQGAFNPKYIGEFAKSSFKKTVGGAAAVDALSILCADPVRPALVLTGDPDFIGVLMPMRHTHKLPAWWTDLKPAATKERSPSKRAKAA